MNEDRIEGNVRSLVGEGEQALGKAVGSERLEGEGMVDQFSGAVQTGYGKAKDAVKRATEEAPVLLEHAAERGRELGRQGDEAIRERLGDRGSTIVAVGAFALLALGLFALVRSSTAPSPKPKSPQGKRKPARRS